jgi:hypothetical protein
MLILTDGSAVLARFTMDQAAAHSSGKTLHLK